MLFTINRKIPVYLFNEKTARSNIDFSPLRYIMLFTITRKIPVYLFNEKTVRFNFEFFAHYVTLCYLQSIEKFLFTYLMKKNRVI
jgi:hypothetical protein